MHINENDIAMFIDGLISDEEREKILEHLDECGECFQKVTLISETILDSEHVPEERISRKILKKAFQTADIQKKSVAAEFFNNLIFKQKKIVFAGIALLIAAFIFYRSLNNNPPVYRDLNGQETLRITNPQNESVITKDELKFEWADENNILIYHFTIYDTKGKIIYNASTETNTYKILKPDNLINGKSYLWMVEAVYKDGAKKQSGLTSFVYYDTKL